MKLRSLRLHGFKSFADRTEVTFHEGITAIVGPNGCGKSNISDAIRWVLGEQRPTAIRGAKMEEAIFQGTVNRRPVNRGSVAMRVSNEDGLLPVPFEEVEIGRTVYRDGGSDYSINRSACRLRDVHDLCRDTGLGANAYAVIESRMIDAILSDRAEERRSLFEEAAGIGKYKDRRKAAARRLERAEVDLQRLEDVIAEVATKVRSLARQKGKAQRYQDLRGRRLSVEVAVVRHQLTALGRRLGEVQQELAGGIATGRGMAAELQTAETELESLQIRRVEAEKERIEAASRLDRVRTDLVRWERDLAVAEERATYASRRLEQIGAEREEARHRASSLEREEGDLQGSRDTLAAEVERLSGEVARSREVAGEVRERLVQARSTLDQIKSRERDVARRGAELEGDATSSEAQVAELDRRLERLRAELEDASNAISELQTQGDLFADRIDGLAAAVADARASAEAARKALEAARGELEGARREELEAADRASELGGQLRALQAMERDREGVEPAVQGALDSGLQGVLGTLSDYVSGPPELVRAVERYLGPVAGGLVVRDRASANALREWFASAWDGGGGLVVLPLDEAPEPEDGGDLLDHVQAVGEGAPWVRALLAGVVLVSEEELLSSGRGRLAPSGASVDDRGVVRIGNPMGATGVLERKERLKGLESEAAEAAAALEAAREERDRAQGSVMDAEAELDRVRGQVRDAEDAEREARAEVAAQFDRRSHMDRVRDELARQVEGTRAAQARARERGEEAREERRLLLEEERQLRDSEDGARRALETVEDEWETVRTEEARRTVELTRQEGELGRVEERIETVAAARAAALDRIGQLDREEEELRVELDKVGALREEGAQATETLFAERDAAEAELRDRDQALATVVEDLGTAERRVRAARAAERETTERRHQLELEQQELSGRIGRIEERLEGEWGKSLELLMKEAEPVEGDPEVLKEELREIVVALERLGPVNMLAVEEHEEESARLAFLTEQRDDLVRARDDLRSAIREINQTATRLFNDTFGAIRENFRATFFRLFQGGEAEIWLSDPDDPLESPIEVHASPVGKKTQRIDLLSGGERALTALSLLFGIYLVKPSPFCVLDEVDAPLDESNISRFIRLLQEFKEQTQFVVITHNPRTIEAADWIYGVTMEEPGVSSIVGVRLEEALGAGSAA